MRYLALTVAVVAASCVTEPAPSSPFNLSAQVVADGVRPPDEIQVEVRTTRAARYVIYSNGKVLARGEAGQEARVDAIAASSLVVGANAIRVIAYDDQGSETVELVANRAADPDPSTIPPTSLCVGDLTGGTASNIDVGATTLTLSAGQTSGTFTSRIFDTEAVYGWGALSWTPERPYGKELPNGSSSETAYAAGNVSMGTSVLSLRFNEASGATFADASPTAALPTCTNCPTAGVASELGFAAQFDGVNDELVIANNASAFEHSTIAVEAWVRVQGQTGGSNTAQTIIAKGTGDGTSTPFASYSLEYQNVAGSFRSYMATQGQNPASFNRAESVFANATLPLPWVHLVATYDSATIRLFIDGTLDNTFLPNPQQALSYGLSATNDLIIGRFDSTYPQRLSAAVDEISVYSSPLTAQQIRDRYLRHALGATIAVRACDDAICSGEAFVDYSERDNTSLGLPTLSLSGHSGRYVQYRVTLSSRASERPVVGGISLCGTLQQ